MYDEDEEEEKIEIIDGLWKQSWILFGGLVFEILLFTYFVCYVESGFMRGRVSFRINCRTIAIEYEFKNFIKLLRMVG